MGIRERTLGLEACGGELVRVLSDIGHAPSLVKLCLPVERSRPCHHHAGCRGSLAQRGYPCSTREYVVAVALDLIKDLGIEHPGGSDAARGSRRQHCDSGISEGVESPVAFDLVRQKGPPLRRHRTPPKINVKEPKIILRKIDSAPIKIFVDIAKKVGELKGQS